RHLNPQMVRVLRTIGFDRQWARGEGAYLYDAEGARYLDLLSGFGVFALGRSHPEIRAALHQALDAQYPSLVQLDAPLIAGIAAEELLRRCHPGMGRVFFTSSGTEAVEAALKFTRCATGRDRVCYAGHAFHGLSLGSLSINGGSEFRKGFGPLLPGCTEVPLGDAAALEAELARRDVAAFIVEPIQGKSLEAPPAAWWDSVQQMCKKYGTLLVVDEVQSGLGRTGKLWAHEHWGVVPDVMTVSKALSGGFVPVGAMICSEEVSDRVYSSMERAVVHSSTFKNNVLAMVAVLATLQVIDDEELVDRARVMGDAFDKALAPLVERYELLHEVRGKGLMIGLRFGEPRSLRLKARYKAIEVARSGLFSQLVVGPLFQRHRILTQVAADGVNVVKLLPPLVVCQEDVDWFATALDDVLADAHSSSSLVFEFGKTLAKGSLRRDR
ncbi:MAG TPA: aspartate aminotransferase family protein, partial [Acidimicrobiales bacterium]|nr:aspartate aminotransferase family protein [Acidimicrobiales bacterium]